MLLDTGFVVAHAVTIAEITLAVIVIKALTAGLSALGLGFPLRTCILVGMALSQVGEFSFVLALVGLKYAVLTETVYNYFLSISIVTMALTPFIIAAGPAASELLLRLPVPRRLREGLYPIDQSVFSPAESKLTDHIVIVGFGLNGRNVARAAIIAGIDYLVIEMNPETVRSERAKGERIIYGDATQEVIQEKANVSHARVLIIVISDPGAVRRTCELARELNPRLYIICRTRFLSEMKALHDAGADEVIPEEFETSVEIFTRVLMRYLIPKEDIERFVAELRADGYEMFRGLGNERPGSCELLPVPGVEISTIRVSDAAEAASQSLAALDLPRQYGVTVLAISRDGSILAGPHGDTVLQPDDALYVLGAPENLATVAPLFSGSDKTVSQR